MNENMLAHLLTKCSLRSKRFRLVSEQKKTEVRDFRFDRARNETRAIFRAVSLTLVPRSSLLNRTETLTTRARQSGSSGGPDLRSHSP